jgi:hypothetical protein
MPVPSAEHPICTRIILAGCPPGDFAAWRLVTAGIIYLP